ncbi:histidine--tRNA ligase [Clostridia bacterium]|nr:histidine--tRNA ligase [Clostridia bacterium]
MKLKYTKPFGTNDICGADVFAWQYVENKIRELCADFGITEIRTPMFEDTELFVRGVGETSDIVTKEMFSFTDPGGRNYTLRPEGTVNAARAYLENGLFNAPQPYKLFYIAPNFRAERPQKGRYRQFHQFGVEYFGAESPYADAEVIFIFHEILRRVGVKNTALKINSLGGAACRQKYNEILKGFIGENLERLCPTCRERFEKNPLRVLDCKNEQCKNIIKNATAAVDCLGTECAAHFSAVKSALDSLGVSYEVDPAIVRGLDYYTRTVFEFHSTDLGAQSALGGGGRYDGLIEECGGSPTGSVGFGVGIERLLIVLNEQGAPLPRPQNPSVCFAYSGEDAKILAFSFANTLRKNGVYAEFDCCERSMKAQFKLSDKLNADFTAIIGGDEIANGYVTVKNMKSGGQERLPLNGFAENFQKYLHKLVD